MSLFGIGYIKNCDGSEFGNRDRLGGSTGRARSNHRSLGPLTPPKAGGAPGVRPFGMTRFCWGAGEAGD